MNKTKIISGILFAGLATGLLLFAQERPDGNKERDIKREREEPRGERDRARDEPRREGDRERDGQHREIEAWLEKREAEINALRKQGKLDRAEALAAETKKVLERYKRAAAERREERDKPREDGGNELERWVQQQERKIAELREAGKKEAAAELQQLVRRKIAEHRKHAERGNIEERVRHIQAAIEHLQAAGLHDWAKELTAHVDREHHNKREQGEHVHGEHEHDHHEDGANNLRREVEELKRAIRAIQKHLKERDR